MDSVQYVHTLMKKNNCERIEDLNFSMIDLNTLFCIFNITDNSLLREDIDKAKKITNKIHPDKSNLPSEYFIFYRKAFDILLQLYDDKRRIDAEITENNTTYQCDDFDYDDDKVVKNMNKEKDDDDDPMTMNNHDDDESKKKANQDRLSLFNKTFNQFFDEHCEKEVISNNGNGNGNDWFKEEKGDEIRPEEYRKMNEEEKMVYDYEFEKNKKEALSISVNDRILMEKKKQEEKRKQYGSTMMLSNEVQPYSSGGGGGSLFKQDYGNNYMFGSSSLPYDDIRRVHRDDELTIVDESEFNKDVNVLLEERKQMREVKMETFSEEKCLKIFSDLEINQRDMYTRQLYESIETTNKNKKISTNFLAKFKQLLNFP